MPIQLRKATIEDCEQIHEMQVVSFRALLDKYHDLETNPGAEPLARVVERMEQPFTDYYFIQLGDVPIGVIRIVRCSEGICRIAPLFILPEYQENGYAQAAILLAETFYPRVNVWQLGTILQEEKLSHLYEKLGYRKTGEQETIQPGMDIVFYMKKK